MNRLKTLLILAIAVALVLFGIRFGMSPMADAFQSRSDSQTSTSNKLAAELRAVGTRVVKAVLAGDAETLLRYDRGSVPSVDREELKKKTGFLHCFLFDASCNANKAPSVRDTLAAARDLQIDAELLMSTTPPAGLLLFYDGRLVDKRQLGSSTYRCKVGGRHELLSWLFTREKDAWVAANPPFDAETDTLCSPPEIESPQ